MIGLFYIHPLTIPFFIVMGLTSYKSRFFLLYFFIFLHELCHTAVSLLLKERVSSLRLYPWGCTLNLLSVPNRAHSLIILSAGPLFNIIMFFLGIYPTENLSLALFNLMPVMPLDGGAIINTLLGKKAFFISLIFILAAFFLCLRLHIFPFIPLLLFIVLFLGEKNRLDKTVNCKITAFFKSKKQSLY